MADLIRGGFGSANCGAPHPKGPKIEYIQSENLYVATSSSIFFPHSSCGDRCFLPFGPDRSHVFVSISSDTATPCLKICYCSWPP